MPDYECLKIRVVTMESKLETHHEKLNSHDKRLSELSESLRENTELTRLTAETSRRTAENTTELVELFRGAKMFRKFVLWASPLIVMCYAAYQWIVEGK